MKSGEGKRLNRKGEESGEKKINLQGHERREKKKLMNSGV